MVDRYACIVYDYTLVPTPNESM